MVEPWIESLWLALEGAFSPGACNYVTTATKQNSVANEVNSAQCTTDDIDFPAVDGLKISHHTSLTATAHDSIDAVTQSNTRQSKFNVSG